jgi:hypothetical protein
VPDVLELYTSDPYVAKLLKALATRMDIGSDIEPAWVESELRCRRHEAIQTLRALGEKQVAMFILGRKGRRTRLNWGFFGEKIAREVINEMNKQLYSLAEKADGGDEDAQNKLEKMATTAKFNEWGEVDEAETWVAVAEMIAPGSPGGQEAQGGKETPSETPTELGSVEDVAVGTQNPVDLRFVDTKIMLRSDLWVTLSLPKDLTEREAERLAGVVRNLWLVPSKGEEPGPPADESSLFAG